MGARVEHVRAAFPALASRNLDLLERLVTPDVEVFVAPDVRFGNPKLWRRSHYRGRGELREWLREVDEDRSHVSVKPRVVEEIGDAVLVLGTLAYESGAAGGGVTLAWVCRFEGELISRIDTYWHWDEARAACAALAA